MNIKMGSAWMLVAAVFFTLMGVFVKRAGSHFPFYELVFWRTLFACIALSGEALWHRRRFYTPHWRAHIWRGTAGTIGLILFFFAITQLPLATAVTLNYTSPLWLALLSAVLLRERIGRNVVLILLAGFVGTVVLLQPTIAAGQELAGLLGVSAGAAAGWAYLQVRELTVLGEPEWRVVFSFSAICTLITGVWSAIAGWHLPQGGEWLDLLAIGFFALIAQMSMTRAYKVGQKFVAASLSYFNVVFAALFGWLFFQDILTATEWLGIAMITLSGVAGSIVGRQKTAAMRRK